MVQTRHNSFPVGGMALGMSSPLAYWNVKEYSEMFNRIVIVTLKNAQNPLDFGIFYSLY